MIEEQAVVKRADGDTHAVDGLGRAAPLTPIPYVIDVISAAEKAVVPI